jgi:hypothetical protein
MSSETLNHLTPIAVYLCWVIGAVDAFVILMFLLERFGPARGRMVSAIGSLFNIFGETSIGASLVELRKWHTNPDEVARPHIQDGRIQQVDVAKRNKFTLWMVNEMVRRYENNAQGLAYLGAAVLIVVIGLRGVQILTKENSAFIVLALLLEFTLIGMLGVMVFYKPEEGKQGNVDIEARVNIRNLNDELTRTKEALDALQENVRKVSKDIAGNVESLRKSVP